MTAPEAEVLILAPFGRDAEIASSILTRSQIQPRICSTLDDVVSSLNDARCLIVTEEALINSDRRAFAAWLEN